MSQSKCAASRSGSFSGRSSALIDVFRRALALVVFAPFFGVIAACHKADSPGPVFFRQTRNGYRGKPFKIFKFRTMHVQEDGPDVRQACPGDRV